MKNIIKISLVVIGMTAMVSCNSTKNNETQTTDSSAVEENTEVTVDSTATETPLPSDSTATTDSTKTK